MGVGGGVGLEEEEEARGVGGVAGAAGPESRS